MLYSTMLCIHNGYICFIYISANDAGGAGGVMTPGLLTHPPPFLVQGVGDDESCIGKEEEGRLKRYCQGQKKQKCESTFFCRIIKL